jgi:hypothetical protein
MNPYHCKIEHILDAVERLKAKGLTDEEIKATPVYIQRIEDFYFERNNWTTVPRGDSNYILAWCPVLLKDEDGKYELGIDAHY